MLVNAALTVSAFFFTSLLFIIGGNAIQFRLTSAACACVGYLFAFNTSYYFIMRRANKKRLQINQETVGMRYSLRDLKEDAIQGVQNSSSLFHHFYQVEADRIRLLARIPLRQAES